MTHSAFTYFRRTCSNYIKNDTIIKNKKKKGLRLDKNLNTHIVDRHKKIKTENILLHDVLQFF